MKDDELLTTPYDENPETEGVFADIPVDAPHRVPVSQQLLLLGAILFMLFGGLITPHILAFFKNTPSSIVATAADSQAAATTTNLKPVTPVATSSPQQNLPDPFAHVNLTAKAAYVWDIQNQTALFAKNPNKQLPLASVTKLMTALLADELLSATSTVPITGTAIAQDGDSGLLKNEDFKRQTLTDLTLMMSSNDGAYALATAAGKLLDPKHPADAFVNAMNVRAQQLGLTNTYYKNPSGLDITTDEPGSAGTVRDMSHLMQYIIEHHPDILAYTRKYKSRIYSESGFYHNTKNTNYDVYKIPGLIGSKTGYTDLAGGNLVVAFDAGLNRPIVVAVLGSTEHDRFTDVLQLVKAARTYTAEHGT